MRYLTAAVWAGAVALAAVSGCGGDDDGVTDVTLLELDPPRGPLAGGVTVTLSGTGFSAEPNMVIIGGAVAREIAAVDDETITAVVPAGIVPGPVDVIVFNSAGFAELEGGFEYNPPPAVTSVTPAEATAGEATTVTIGGRGFLDREPGTNTVTIGTESCANVTVVDDATLTCEVSGADAPGFVRLPATVSNANGTGSLDATIRFRKDGLLVGHGSQSDTPGLLVYVDPATGETAEVAPLPRQIQVMATAPDGTIFVVLRGPEELHTYDVATGALTRVGAMEFRPHGMAFDGTTLYASNHRRFPSCCSSPTPLRTLSVEDASATQIGGNISQAFAIDVEGNAVSAASTCGTLNSVDLSTGVESATSVTLADEDCRGLLDLTFLGDELYGIKRDTISFPPPGGKGGGFSAVVHIDTETGAVTELAVLPFGIHAITGVTF